MKKVICVLLSILMVFGSCAVIAFAADEETTTVTEETTAAKEEVTTRYIKNDEGLVVPINFTQLKDSVVFKIIEKIIKWFLSLFTSDNGDAIDSTAADAVSEIVSVIDERVSEVNSTLDAATSTTVAAN